MVAAAGVDLERSADGGAGGIAGGSESRTERGRANESRGRFRTSVRLWEKAKGW